MIKKFLTKEQTVTIIGIVALAIADALLHSKHRVGR